MNARSADADFTLYFRPFQAAVLCLIANTSPVAYGGLGTPLITLEGVTQGLPGETLSMMAGHQLPFMSLIVPRGSAGPYLNESGEGERRTRDERPAVRAIPGSAHQGKAPETGPFSRWTVCTPLWTLDCDKDAIRRGLSRRTSRPRRRTGRRCSISDEAASSAALTASFCSPQPTHPRLPPTPGTPQGQTRKLVRNRGIRVKRGERFRLARRG